MNDPFRTLGLTSRASAADVRAARRELAKRHHPDAGGDGNDMRTVNDAAAAALRSIAARSGPSPSSAATSTAGSESPGPGTGRAPGETARDAARDPGGVEFDPLWSASAHDVPSFTVEALPVETFEALLVVASEIGEVVDDDPPYRLDVLLGAPIPSWCRLELVPDAGASTVSLMVSAVDGGRRPSVEAVRDVWISHLNRLDW